MDHYSKTTWQETLKQSPIFSSVLKTPSSSPESDSLDELSPRQKKQYGEITPHRLIEKRRRDKINACLDELRALVVPVAKAKGKKTDKADILKLTIEHIQDLKSSQSKESAENNTSKDIHQNILSGFEDCKSSVIEFLKNNENLPDGHPFLKRLQSHLLKKQENLDLKRVSKSKMKFKSIRDLLAKSPKKHRAPFRQLTFQEPSNDDNINCNRSSKSLIFNNELIQNPLEDFSVVPLHAHGSGRNFHEVLHPLNPPVPIMTSPALPQQPIMSPSYHCRPISPLYNRSASLYSSASVLHHDPFHQFQK